MNVLLISGVLFTRICNIFKSLITAIIKTLDDFEYCFIKLFSKILTFIPDVCTVQAIKVLGRVINLLTIGHQIHSKILWISMNYKYMFTNSLVLVSKNPSKSISPKTITNSFGKLGHCLTEKNIRSVLLCIKLPILIIIIRARISHDEYWKWTVLIGVVSVKMYAD